jgi:signal transduction histidine kinase
MAAAAQELLAALLFGLTFWFHPRARETASAALFCLCASAHALVVALAPRETLAAAAALVVALALAVKHAVTVLVPRRRELVPAAVGGAALLAALAHDAGTAFGAREEWHLADVGLLACALGMLLTWSARSARVHDELAERTEAFELVASEAERIREQLAAAREALAQKEQLAVVGELAAVIAHEVRNPLAVIANAVAGLRKEAISREDHATLLSILDEETRRLNRLVSDLLRYARPISVQRTHFCLRDVLDRALVHVRAADGGIETAVRIECEGDRVWGDANLLRQVFDNLVENAVQAMTGGGKLTVRIRAAAAEGVEGFCVDIIDTGEGMDTHVQSRARDPFFTTRPSGTGLGLAIVDRIVAAHDGHVWIDSQTGEGTTVTVFLPLGSPSEPPPPPSKRASYGPDVGPELAVSRAAQG